MLFMNIKKNLERRFFLKKMSFLLIISVFIFNKKKSLFLNKNQNYLEILDNFKFAKKKYHNHTTNFIFTNFLVNKNSVKNIMINMEKDETFLILY